MRTALVQFGLYSFLYAAALVPGLPAGWRLFGRGHPAGWVAGGLIGYALTALAVWLSIRAGFPSSATFAAVWASVCAITWAALRNRSAALVPLQPWRRADTVAYALVLALTVAIAAPPLATVGIRDEQGNRYYRAYFTADFVWHTALTAELGRFSMPPRNPFLRHRPVHYYWTYFLPPAAISTTGPSVLRDVERCLQLNAFFNGLLFISALFMSVRAAVPSSSGAASAAAGVSVALAIVASSAEAWDWLRRSPSLASARYVNIDAITAWEWNGYRVDGLQRAIWYNPQHSMSGALGLVALAAAAAGGSAASLASGLLTGVALAGAIAMNPFVGATFALTYGVATILDAPRHPAPFRRIGYSAAAALPALAAVGWCVANRMAEGAGGALEFGFNRLSRNSPVQTLLLSLGPALLPAIAGLLSRAGPPFRTFLPAAVLAALALFLMYFVRLSVDVYWVAFRSGHLMLVSLPALGARFFVWALQSARPLAAAVIVVTFAAGAPTLLIDAYNARDITNHVISSGGFPWTRVVTPQQQAAFRWMREQTPATAVIQQDAISREPNTWWVVPTFGQRRMAAGLPPFLLEVPEYREKSELVRTMYATPDASQAWAIAHGLRIDYIYIDAVERKAYPDGMEKFDDFRYFDQAFHNDEASIYRVR